MIDPISAQELRARLEAEMDAPILLDVREDWEFEVCHIAGSRLIPMSSLPARLDEIDRQSPVVVICHHGMRSYQAALFLEDAGFERISNLTGGIDAWANDVDPAMRRY